MPYIGVFTDEAIQKAIVRAGSKLGEGKSGLVVHLDTNDEFSASIIKKIGGHVSVEVAGVLNTSEGFKFDKEHLKAQGELIWQW